MIIWHHPLHHNNANVNDHDHHHHLNHNNNNDHHHLQTTPGKPFSLSSSTSSFRPRTVSTLFGSSSYFSFWISHHNHHYGHNFLHPCNFINCRHLWLPGYKLSSVSYPDPTKLNEISIFDFCVQVHLHILFIFCSIAFTYFLRFLLLCNVLTWIWLGLGCRIFYRAERQSPALLGSPCKITFIITTRVASRW